VVRTTLTLEDDVAARLAAEARRSGQSFKDVVNDLLRFALDMRKSKQGRPFRVQAPALGLRQGLQYDDVGGLLEQVEGPGHR
jgi:hypothetical protein